MDFEEKGKGYYLLQGSHCRIESFQVADLQQPAAAAKITVVANETITFRKSLELFSRFDVETKWIGHDDRALYMEHRAVVDGEVYARAIVRARILRRSGGPVTHEELFGALGFAGDLPQAPEWAHDWSEAARLPGTRKPAPSEWE